LRRNAMLRPPTPEQARRLRDFFIANGYTEQGIQEQLGTRIPMPPYAPMMPALLARIAGSSTFDLLARCFFLGQPIAKEAGATLPGDVLTIMHDCDVLHTDRNALRPAALIVPCRGLWLASDTHQQRETAGAKDHVMTVNEPALALLDFAVPVAGERVLDLCSGVLLHGLAAGVGAQVTGADLNPRAALFGNFNAALNEHENVRCVTGDLFEPVAGQRFDLILSNPPFVISPGSGYSFRENPQALDDFCRRLVREVSNHLQEGGFCELICEWVELEDRPWEARLADWFRDTGCDVWVLAANRQLPQTYVRDWVAETSYEDDQPSDERYTAWLGHLIERGVTAVHGGLICMRRRSGDNWTSFSRIEQGMPSKPVGAAVLQGFHNRDFLHAHRSDATFAQTRLAVAPGARLESKSAWREGDWRPDSMILSVEDGVPVRVGLDPNVMALIQRVARCPTLAEAVADFADAQGMPVDKIAEQCLGILRRLLEQGCLVPVPGP
jgi:hypothetical protein